MMTYHYTDPTREHRDCDTCRPSGKPNPYIYGSGGAIISDCDACNGTGKLGDPHALPDVEVFFLEKNQIAVTEGIKVVASEHERGWFYAHGSPGTLWDSEPVGPFDAEVEALEAAREAAGLCPHGVPDDGVCEECPASELWVWELDPAWFACGTPGTGGRTADITRAMAWGNESAARKSAGRMAFCDGGVPRRLSDADARRWGKSD